MARQFRWLLAAVFVCTISSARATALSCAPIDCDGAGQAAPQQKPPGDHKPDGRGPERGPMIKWWEDAKWRGELGISDRQSGKIDGIFESEMGKLRDNREERIKLEAVIEQLLKEPQPDLALLTAKWERVGTLLSESYKTRQLMLYRMDRVLKPEQRVKLQAMYDKIQAERRQKEPERRR
jgi:Spy/CpxP family protein refolding chaperone